MGLLLHLLMAPPVNLLLLHLCLDRCGWQRHP
jgi:hypothetical protein